MEPLQQQILTLSEKLDALYQVIEQLDGKVAQAFSECSLANTQAKDNYQENGAAGGYQLKGRISLNPEMEHKDVLTDGIYLDMHRLRWRQHNTRNSNTTTDSAINSSI